MKTSLTRSIGFWLLLVLALAATAAGGWLISDQLGTMTTNLLDNTATGVDVYVGQSLVVVGAALLGAGGLGILLAVALVAAQSLVPTGAPGATLVTSEPLDETVDDEAVVDEAVDDEAVDRTDEESADAGIDDQKGSSGSTATATKISVK